MTRATKERPGAVAMSDAEALWYSGTWIDRTPQWASITFFGLLFLAFWWVIAELEFVSRILLPGPAETFEELWDVTKNIFTGVKTENDRRIGKPCYSAVNRAMQAIQIH